MDRHLEEGRGRSPRWVVAQALLVLALVTTASAGHAEPPTASPPEEMAALADMVGTWEGEGWARQGGGEPSRFESREVVESRLEGEALLIEGTHRSRETGEVVHHALALLSWDASAGVYRFRTQVAGRDPASFEGRMEDGVFVWGGAAGPGQMRYRIQIEGDAWNEVGEFSRDGETWNQFFEMTLTRRK